MSAAVRFPVILSFPRIPVRRDSMQIAGWALEGLRERKIVQKTAAPASSAGI